MHSSPVRRIGILLLAVGMAGCATCTLIGCNNRLYFTIGEDLLPGTAYEARVCFDSACAEGTLIARDDGVFGVAGPLTLIPGEDAIEYQLGDGDFSGRHRISFSLRDPSGRELASMDDGAVELTRYEPNGGWPCGPTCWTGDFAFP
jgi:hypothetical protein